MPTPNINSILRKDPRNCSRGAPMGDRNYWSEEAGPLFLQRVIFQDGDYAPDGTYWGGGRGTDPLYCAFSYPDSEARIYTRAHSRSHAAALLKEEYPDAVLRYPPKPYVAPRRLDDLQIRPRL